jgi:fucose permease
MDRKTEIKFYFMIGFVLYFLAISMIITGAALPKWMDIFQVTAGRAGRLFFLYYLTYVITTFSSGFLCDHFGKKPIIVLSQLFLGIGFFCISTAHSFLFIELGMLIMGLGGGFCEAPMTGFISQVFNGREGFALNMSQIFFGIGAASGPFLTGYLLGIGFSWRYLYLIPGIVSIGLFFLIYFEKKLFQKEKKGITSGSILILYQRWKAFLAVSCLAMLLYVGSEIASSSWMSTYIVKGLKGNLYLGGVTMAGYWGMITIGRIVFAYLSQRNHYGVLLRISSIISLVFLFLLLMTNSIPLVILSFMGIGFGFSGIWPLVVAVVAKNIEEMQATAIGVVVALGGTGALLFPWLFGIFSDYMGLRFIFIMVVVLVVAMFLVFQSRFFKGSMKT